MSGTETMPKPRPIPRLRLVLGGGVALVVLTGATVAGVIPRIAARRALARVAAIDATPMVNVVTVTRAGAASSLTLPGTIQPAHQAAILTGRSFFPALISTPFGNGLRTAFDFSIGACLLAAASSWIRGGRYVHVEESTEAEEELALPVAVSEEAVL